MSLDTAYQMMAQGLTGATGVGADYLARLQAARDAQAAMERRKQVLDSAAKIREQRKIERLKREAEAYGFQFPEAGTFERALVLRAAGLDPSAESPSVGSSEDEALAMARNDLASRGIDPDAPENKEDLARVLEVAQSRAARKRAAGATGTAMDRVAAASDSVAPSTSKAGDRGSNRARELTTSRESNPGEIANALSGSASARGGAILGHEPRGFADIEAELEGLQAEYDYIRQNPQAATSDDLAAVMNRISGLKGIIDARNASDNSLRGDQTSLIQGAMNQQGSAIARTMEAEAGQRKMEFEADQAAKDRANRLGIARISAEPRRMAVAASAGDDQRDLLYQRAQVAERLMNNTRKNLSTIIATIGKLPRARAEEYARQQGFEVIPGGIFQKAQFSPSEAQKELLLWATQNNERAQRELNNYIRNTTKPGLLDDEGGRPNPSPRPPRPGRAPVNLETFNK